MVPLMIKTYLPWGKDQLDGLIHWESIMLANNIQEYVFLKKDYAGWFSQLSIQLTWTRFSKHLCFSGVIMHVSRCHINFI